MPWRSSLSKRVEGTAIRDTRGDRTRKLAAEQAFLTALTKPLAHAPTKSGDGRIGVGVFVAVVPFVGRRRGCRLTKDGPPRIGNGVLQYGPVRPEQLCRKPVRREVTNGCDLVVGVASQLAIDLAFEDDSDELNFLAVPTPVDLRPDVAVDPEEPRQTN